MSASAAAWSSRARSAACSVTASRIVCGPRSLWRTSGGSAGRRLAGSSAQEYSALRTRLTLSTPERAVKPYFASVMIARPSVSPSSMTAAHRLAGTSHCASARSSPGCCERSTLP